MTAASPAAIARAFVTARQQATGFSDYPGPIPPSLADGYAIQAEALALVDAPVGGWKVGRVPAPLVERFGADRLAGPIFTFGGIEGQVFSAEAGQRQALASARTCFITCSASPKPTPRVLAPVRFPLNSMTTSDAISPAVDRNSARPPAGRAA